MVFYILFETASGYALFQRNESDEIGDNADAVQEHLKDFKRFSKIVTLKAIDPFTSSEEALENANDVSEGVLNSKLKHFLEMNIAVSKKEKESKQHVLGLGEDKLGSSIQEALKINCVKSAVVLELLRGIRFHYESYVNSMKEGALKEGDLRKAQLGLGHSYSRAKVKFNVNKADNMIIQSINLLDQLDKDINTFAMRLREWYGLHFPELVKIVNDNAQYAKCVQIIKSRAQFTDEQVPALEEVFTETPSKGKDIFNAAKTSMGADISQYDLDSIWSFSERVIKLTDYRRHLHDYLLKKMNDIAPNLSALIGEMVGARLIAHAGSLTNLAKYPASTVQILGAEKALFRALKTRGNTPKYGLIFNSSFIGRAKAKDKGRISRYLANKCSIAARIDSFLDYPTTKFGEKLKEQVEERLKFYETGVAPQKNVDVMKSAIEAVKAETDKMQVDGENGGSEKKNKKRKKPEGDDEEEEKKEKKKAKKDKKEKRKSSKSKNE